MYDLLVLNFVFTHLYHADICVHLNILSIKYSEKDQCRPLYSLGEFLRTQFMTVLLFLLKPRNV